MIPTIETNLISFAKFCSECHLIGSVELPGCRAAIVFCSRAQWNLTLDRAEACCQEQNLIPSSCSHSTVIKKGLCPHPAKYEFSIHAEERRCALLLLVYFSNFAEDQFLKKEIR